MRGKPINFVGIRDQVFEQLAGTIAGEIDRLWAQDWDIDLILLTGGGSRELARHLKPQIDGNVVPLEPHIDSRLNNVFGYVKYGKFVWGAGSLLKPAGEDAAGHAQETPERVSARAA
jgi:plasmid segregation protein ParM